LVLQHQNMRVYDKGVPAYVIIENVFLNAVQLFNGTLDGILELGNLSFDLLFLDRVFLHVDPAALQKIDLPYGDP